MLKEATVRKDKDQKQFFKDLGAATEQAVKEVRGFELTHQAWTAGINEKLHGYAKQDFGAAFAFARNLTQARDFNDFVRIQVDYVQNCSELFLSQVKDLTQTYANSVLGLITPPAYYFPG
jgi:hypothetical protein